MKLKQKLYEATEYRDLREWMNATCEKYANNIAFTECPSPPLPGGTFQ